MNREHEAQREQGDLAAVPVAPPGRRSLIASRYPALAQALGDHGGEPTIHDAATTAVEHKDGGAAVDGGVAARVGAHLGADFSSVRVHSDPLAQQATAAMGARAFAYGSDVFLGPGESGGDVHLMAHELTHVAQQGAAGQRAVQRAVQVGDANSPAEREADQVAAEVTGGQGRSATLLVDDSPVGPGQMLKSQFLEQLRAEVTAAADAELGPIYSAIGCPYIDQYFGRYANQPASAGEALLRRFAPTMRDARAAADMIPAVVARVREGVRAWKETGAAPDMPEGAGLPAGGPVAAAMGEAQAMDASTAARMTDALGDDVAGAQLHLGPEAQAFAARHDALAVTVGPHVAFAPGAYQPGTIEGDALLAHELGHVAQQKGAAMPAGDAIPAAGEALEADADQSAASALARLWGGAQSAARKAGDVMRSGLALARCKGAATPDITRVPAGPAREAAIALQGSTATIDQNTARRLADGSLNVAYMEDLAHAPDEAAILAAQTPPRSSPAWSVLVHPTTNERMLIPQNAAGFQQSGYLFGQRSRTPEYWRTILVHEMSHAVNSDADTAPTSFARYSGEFRAYWVSEYQRVPDLDERARQIKAHVLGTYPDLNAQYTSNATFRGQVDAHTRPDGNLDNH